MRGRPDSQIHPLKRRSRSCSTFGRLCVCARERARFPWRMARSSDPDLSCATDRNASAASSSLESPFRLAISASWSSSLKA